MPATAELAKYDNLPTANSNTTCKGLISILVYIVRFMNTHEFAYYYISFWFEL